MGKAICCECGDLGFEKKLVYCLECKQALGHSYCGEYKHGMICTTCELTKLKIEEKEEPYMVSVWTGSLDLVQDESNFLRIEGFHAFLSTRAHKAAAQLAAQMEPTVEVEVLPRFLLWPKDFDGSIGIYFFPSLAKREAYESLLDEMVRDDVAMRALQPDGSELLIFASILLPRNMCKFQGRLFMWGYCAT
ncbi:RING/FYVE/PHD zinc finger superfamily protein [Striga asiatica]|uniref:RING/FYVE/PHD zinc finger superfamily protein n=1 Tax=Striga asiatica TaxID=4170 RepID=A0A5A7PGL1_STRAF|nr:RING/FYVE/PHD zinc finger superfamily protein [Striga asiatica]